MGNGLHNSKVRLILLKSAHTWEWRGPINKGYGSLKVIKNQSLLVDGNNFSCHYFTEEYDGLSHPRPPLSPVSWMTRKNCQRAKAQTWTNFKIKQHVQVLSQHHNKAHIIRNCHFYYYYYNLRQFLSSLFSYSLHLQMLNFFKIQLYINLSICILFKFVQLLFTLAATFLMFHKPNWQCDVVHAKFALIWLWENNIQNNVTAFWMTENKQM